MGGLNPREVNAACALVEQIRADGVSVILVEHVMKAIMRISNRHRRDPSRREDRRRASGARGE